MEDQEVDNGCCMLSVVAEKEQSITQSLEQINGNGEANNEASEDSSKKSNNNGFLSIDRSLVHCKLLYFCYQSALGALWPYLPLYLKQLFLTPRQVGTIVASRTFVQFLCVPFWTGVADKYKRHKMILLLAIFAWLVSTMALLIVPAEQPKACFKMGLKRASETNDFEDMWFDFKISDLTLLGESGRGKHEETARRNSERGRRDVYYDVKIYSANASNFTPKYSAYDPDQHVLDSSRLYLLILFITIFGIMISAPSLILVDICTLQKLKSKPHLYGRQALWGSVGFGLFAFSVGTLVNFVHTTNMCTRKDDVNYVPCFYVFAFFMTVTLLVGSQLTFEYDNSEDSNRPSFIQGLKSIHDVHLLSLLVVTFYCGMGSGFISTFLFWHLREMGGVQILMALVTLLNSSAEVLFYVMSEKIIHCIGHFRVIYLGLLCFAVRFFYYSFLRAPWLVLPIEITHGMTSAAIRSALIAYLGKDTKSGTVLQGVFNGVHSGLGFSIGGLTGGIMVHEFGHSTTFLIFGEVSLVIMFSFILVNNVWPNDKFDEIQKNNSDLCETENSTRTETIDESEATKSCSVQLDQIIDQKFTSLNK
eukprot:gene3022-3481_t